ncbi:MAG: HlyD family secretion protein [Rhodospirillaceae bacterium]|nr:HlyD family secretion protein [Rhodospirillaceae bacterium]MBT4045837.1 HlyD family secretion protein [Rhodospirillaceae bacterium]MBT4689792.1 HlyD family secretion protein [Rhodospirillaceae bacterium]MBT5081238.1 HlyD family secretion protein [Rhodospirillaceae bacterium]MBT5522630.1 HlyD family secretion protein [Rhodospirillaceae bacterium]
MDKQTDSQSEAQAGASDSQLPQGGSDSGLRRLLGRGLLLAAVAVGLAGLIYWVYGRYTNVVVYDARIKADMVMMSSRIDGWVTDVPASEGNKVEAGKPLIVIDDRESTLRLREIDAQRKSMRAERGRIEAEIRMIDHQTQGRFQASRAALTAAEAAKAGMDTELEQIRSDYERGQSLLAKKVISRQRWESLRTAYRMAGQEVLKSEADVAQATASVMEAQADRQRIDVLQGRLASLRFDEERLDTQHERQQLDLSDRTIKAPSNGTVDRTFVDPGEYVARGQRLLLMHNSDVIWVEANIKETDIRDVKLGAKAKILVDAYPDLEVVGEVVRIGNAATNQFALLPSPNPSGSFTKITQRLPVKIAIPQTEGLLRPGMMVEVEIAITRD